jgi:hypothetical protein
VLEYWERGLGKGTFEDQTFSFDVLILSKGYVRPSGQNAIQTD